MVFCLERCVGLNNLHMVQLMPPLKSRMVVPFLCRLTQVVLKKTVKCSTEVQCKFDDVLVSKNVRLTCDQKLVKASLIYRTEPKQYRICKKQYRICKYSVIHKHAMSNLQALQNSVISLTLRRTSTMFSYGYSSCIWSGCGATSSLYTVCQSRFYKNVHSYSQSFKILNPVKS